VRARVPAAGIEVLTPDFRGDKAAVSVILGAEPDVFSHNLETCRRLTPQVRSEADYERSLAVLAAAARSGAGSVLVKSGFMLGLGEDAAEVRTMLGDLREHGAALLTIGQYLPPSPQHWPLARYVTPEEFRRWQDTARREYGFLHVVSGPQVRSSYRAEEAHLSARRDGWG